MDTTPNYSCESFRDDLAAVTLWFAGGQRAENSSRNARWDTDAVLDTIGSLTKYLADHGTGLVTHTDMADAAANCIDGWPTDVGPLFIWQRLARLAGRIPPSSEWDGARDLDTYLNTYT